MTQHQNVYQCKFYDEPRVFLWVNLNQQLFVLSQQFRLMITKDATDKPKSFRVEDFLSWAEEEFLVPKTTQFESDQYENPRSFTFLAQVSVKQVTTDEGKKQVETDLSFVSSITELCWRKFGLNRHKRQLTPEECSRIHQEASEYQERQSINAPQLICDNVMGVQYLTYDNVFFFFFLKVLFINGIILSLGFVLPAMYWYGQGTRYKTASLFNCDSSYCQFIDRFSLYNEENPGSNLRDLEWIGLAVIGLLQFTFYLAWKYNKEIREVLRYEARCSDCTMLISGLPEGRYNEKDLLQFCDGKFQTETRTLKLPSQSEERIFVPGRTASLAQIQLQTNEVIQKQRELSPSFSGNAPPTGQRNRLRIRGVQIVYDCSEAKEMIALLEQASKEAWSLLQQGQQEQATVYFVSDVEKYSQKKKEVIDTFERLSHWRKYIINFLQ